MNSSSKKKNILVGYVQNKNFGPYYFPVAQQNQILKLYCEQKKKIFTTSSRTNFFKKVPQIKIFIKRTKKK